MNPDLRLVANAELLLRAAEMKREPSRRYCPHSPTPKQREFLGLDVLEALYGGAAGGGKSDALLMCALQYVHVPGYAALLLRRKMTDLVLPGALLDRAHAWLRGTAAEWDADRLAYVFPTGGEPATITFGYFNRERDFDRYAGPAFQYIGCDELTQLPERWYRKLFSRLRRLVGQPVPIRMRGASNPGGIGHEWVRRRFVDDATRGKRVFVPANRRDNPHVDQEAYATALAELDETTRLQLDEGVWIADTGGLVYQFEGTRNRGIAQPLDEHGRPVPGWSFVLGIDYGFDDATAFAVLGWAPHDRTVYVVETFKRSEMTPGDAAREALRLEGKYGFDRIIGDVGGLGKGYAEEAKQRFKIPIEPAEKKNKRGYIELFNGELRGGRVKLLPGNDALVTEWAELAWTEDRAKESPGFDNHIADAVLYAWRSAYAYAEEDAPAVMRPVTAEDRIAARLREQQQREDEELERLIGTERPRHFSQRYHRGR